MITSTRAPSPKDAPAASPGQPHPWHALSVDEAARLSGSGPDGLSPEEAARRLEALGPNVIPRAGGDSALRILLRQVNNPLVWVLVGAAAVAVGLGELTDGAVVLAVVLTNAFIGFVQEYRANRAIEALAEMVPHHAEVVRAGRRQSLPVAQLVPGDHVLLASGDKVPADLRLTAVKGLQVEEAALTGESVPVTKAVAPVAADAPLGDRTCLAFSGTLVTAGTGRGLVMATGQATELGRISSLLREATHVETPLTRDLARVGKWLTVGILAVAGVILAAGMWRATASGIPAGEAARESLLFAISLAVGAIPEGLPAIVTVALAIGVRRMAVRRAIIRRLPSVETLGATTVICSDKTGTLTRNEMTVRAGWTVAGGFEVEGVGYQPGGRVRRGPGQLGDAPPDVARLLEAAALCSDAELHREGAAWKATGDPTEVALLVAAERGGVRLEEARRRWPRLDAVPFESEHQYMATLHRDPEGGHRLVLKGAPEVVARRCGPHPGGADGDTARMAAEAERLAAQGMRVLAVAERSWDAPAVERAAVGDGFRLLGLVGMIDPPRSEAMAAVAACRAAGIAVKMITGDHRATAQAIGEQLGLGGGLALGGTDLEALSADDLRQATRSTSVFARVAPEHKLRLVRALQQEGHVVAMTGDGVNDAPALKQADIGVAMGITGTSVSKEAADMVLADDNFASIVAAVEEGRRVYDNLVKSLAFVLPTNIGLALVLTWAVLFVPFDPSTGELLLPVLPTQLLWINLAAAVTLALPLAFEVLEPDAMARPPRDPREPILSPLVLRRTVLAAVLMTAAAVGVFRWEYTAALAAGEPARLALSEAQTITVTAIIAFQTFYMLQCRSLRSSLWRVGFASNPVVFAGVAAAVALQAAFVYAPPVNRIFGTAPLGPRDLLVAIAAGAVVLPVIGLEKWWTGRRGARPAA